VDITLSLTITDGDKPVIEQEIIQLSKSFRPDELIGLSLAESKRLLKTLQQQIVELQASQYIESQKRCPCCEKNADSKNIEISIIERSSASFHCLHLGFSIVSVKSVIENPLVY
jgi:hypothetical protein